MCWQKGRPSSCGLLVSALAPLSQNLAITVAASRAACTLESMENAGTSEKNLWDMIYDRHAVRLFFKSGLLRALMGLGCLSWRVSGQPTILGRRGARIGHWESKVAG